MPEPEGGEKKTGRPRAAVMCRCFISLVRRESAIGQPCLREEKILTHQRKAAAGESPTRAAKMPGRRHRTRKGRKKIALEKGGRKASSSVKKGRGLSRALAKPSALS